MTFQKLTDKLYEGLVFLLAVVFFCVVIPLLVIVACVFFFLIWLMDKIMRVFQCSSN